MSDYARWLALPASLRPIGPKFCTACGKATGTTVAQWREHVAQCPHRAQEGGPMSAEQLQREREAVAKLDKAVERFKRLLLLGTSNALRGAYNDVVLALHTCERRAEEARREEVSLGVRRR